jgi:hypothetical protein
LAREIILILPQAMADAVGGGYLYRLVMVGKPRLPGTGE